jgi:hypothetical protein
MGLKLDSIGASASAGIDEGVRRAKTPIVGLRDLGDNAALRAQTRRMSHICNVLHVSSLITLYSFLASSSTPNTLSGVVTQRQTRVRFTR